VIQKELSKKKTVERRKIGKGGFDATGNVGLGTQNKKGKRKRHSLKGGSGGKKGGRA